VARRPSGGKATERDRQAALTDRHLERGERKLGVWLPGALVDWLKAEAAAAGLTQGQWLERELRRLQQESGHTPTEVRHPSATTHGKNEMQNR